MALFFLPLLAALIARPASAATLQILAYDGGGRALDAEGLRGFIGRADRRDAQAGLVLSAPDGSGGFIRPQLAQGKERPVLSWKGLPKAQMALSWPIPEDGFSTVWLDRQGEGYGDGETVFLNQEIALAQYRAFREAWLKRTKDWDPRYKPGAKAEKLARQARDAVADAQKAGEGAGRAAAFDKALRETSLAWQKMLVEHGEQVARNPRHKQNLRFGLTLDDSFVNAVNDYQWIVDMVARSGSNWARLVFRSNPEDFAYAQPRSFILYDAVVAELRKKNIRVMGTVLDTAQWPKGLTPAVYAARAKNLAIHFGEGIRSWEVGSEINGDWLGGPRTPLGLDKTFAIYSAAAEKIKEVDPSLETVATLYWWEATAPDEAHSLFGWLKRFVPKGFGANLDVVAVSLQPEDNPVGTAFERIFERVREALPAQKLMLGSFGYVEKKDLGGYWWLDPSDVDGARKDLLVLYTPASCAPAKSVCGGFWWQTLDQMLLREKRATDLFRVYQRSLEKLGR